ncbi:MAG: YebC/PmpR family DNA-binding transcriptional regulator [Promicromonosporaceae bacterium]|nr:YebC/PmpR family DNA-binding transcriptional regulator [Promicromonosporaceae bacterium]
MSGHSKWATTKHKKAVIDARRGKLFAKLIKNIEVAARAGADPNGNPTLYDAIVKAKKNSVPNDNIDRAVKRGSGAGSDAVQYLDKMYGGVIGGVAVYVECLTDNVNRAVAEVRVTFTRNGGKFADDIGSVARLFTRKGEILVPKTGSLTEDDVMLPALDAGAEDVSEQGDMIEVLCDPSDLVEVRKAIQGAGIDYDSAEAIFYPNQFTVVSADLDTAQKVTRLVDALEDLDDVQNVYTNMDLSDEIANQLAESE